VEPWREQRLERGRRYVHHATAAATRRATTTQHTTHNTQVRRAIKAGVPAERISLSTQELPEGAELAEVRNDVSQKDLVSYALRSNGSNCGSK
jgi:hypothetical protein